MGRGKTLPQQHIQSSLAFYLEVMTELPPPLHKKKNISNQKILEEAILNVSSGGTDALSNNNI